MSEYIQVRDAKMVVNDAPEIGNPTELSAWPIRIDEPIENAMTLSFKSMVPADEKDIAVTGMDFIRGFFLHATGIVEVYEGEALIARGKDIHITSADISKIKVKAISKEFTTGKVETVDGVAVVVKDDNYVYSKLTSTEIIGPFPAIGNYIFTALIGTMEVLDISIDIAAADAEVGITGAEVAAEFTSMINTALGRDGVLMIYDSDEHCFVLKNLEVGANKLEFIGNTAIYIGMDSGVLQDGTVDIAGMTIEAINGIGEGTSKVISSCDVDNVVTMVSELTGLAVGDMVKIYDSTSDVEIDVDILLYQ